jgi:hypothetical protein
MSFGLTNDDSVVRGSFERRISRTEGFEVEVVVVVVVVVVVLVGRGEPPVTL